MAKYKITAPVADYVGSISGVQFTGGVATVDDDVPVCAAVLNYCRAAGYTVEPLEQPRAKDAGKSAETPEPGQDGPYDPAAHGMPEVLAYLADADEAEATRVLDAEAAGKGRKGIVDQRDTILARARENDASKEQNQ